MTKPSDDVRINFDIPIELRNRFSKVGVPWGVRAPVMRKLFEMLVDTIERDGLVALGAFLDGSFEFRLKKRDENVETG